ncbi:DNA polymerase zeta, catalytic subunit [Mycena rebaudengoi]|nr:DNA polymerase zeta, catalytic subunit [Mycena rebaudengoi]
MSSSPVPVLQVQINHIDHCVLPSGPYDNSSLPTVPVIRIFGPSSTGKKCCVHVHQGSDFSFAYFPFPFSPSLSKYIHIFLNRYIATLTQSLNHAIALSLKKDISYRPQFVRAIVLVKGVHFYGFHSSYSPFLKIHIVDPALVNRAVTIARSGSIMKTHFRVFESHLSFALQFMSDFGLYGCGWIDLSQVFQLPPSFQVSPQYCQTRMPLEVDASAYHILNRLRVNARNLHHKLVIPAPLLPPEPLVLSVRELWDDERNRRRARSGGEWVAEARYWDAIRKRIESERESTSAAPKAENDWGNWVMTTFESHLEREAEWEKSLQHDIDEAPEEDEAEDQVDHDELEQSPPEHSFQRFSSTLPNHPRYNTHSKLKRLGCSSCRSRPRKFGLSESPSPPSSRRTSPGGSPPHKKRRVENLLGRTSRSVHASLTNAMNVITQRPKIINLNRHVYAPTPPTTAQLLESLEAHAIPHKIYRAAHYSDDNDAQNRPREYGGLIYRLKGNHESLKNLDPWQSDGILFSSPKESFSHSSSAGGWEYSGSPPSVRQVKQWLGSEGGRLPVKKPVKLRSQIEGPTQKNIYGLKTSPAEETSGCREKEKMTVMSLEVFGTLQPSSSFWFILKPDSEHDEIMAVFYSFQEVDSSDLSGGMILVDQAPIRIDSRLKADVVPTELDLLNQVVDVVLDLDPDIVVGWEIQAASSGSGLDIADQISRAPTKRSAGKDIWGARHTSTFKVTGRHVFNLWRIMRVEQTLNIYTFENVVFHVLARRIPRYSFATLLEWFRDPISAHKALVLRYFASRTSMVLEVLEETEVVTKTAEFARVFGVDFFSVISRGSQFKVESFMFRIAKPESFVLLSPSREDVGRQNAAECMPLIMEPLSGFYTSPVLVLDFQSLYPSIMIANNYCYSTFVGRVHDFQGKQKFGVSELEKRPGLAETLYDHLNVSPNGMMFVKPEVRKGLLSRMLVELLDTRVMVKQAMKGAKNDKALTRILNARQLGLKYIANVTYGYTGATFSGRMPAVEVADRLQAIRMINATEKWGAQVRRARSPCIHFRHLHGRTKDQAFRIGQDIADTITAMNPSPIKLKFEKASSLFGVYLPCVLLAKKRYVGFKFENPDDVEPVFDAKGIETVRRDGVPAQQKMTENCLKILFRTQDLSDVKDYCTRSWQKLLDSKASIQDFIFAKEVKMGTYSDKVPPPPGVALAARQAITDNIEPQYSERVPYVICRGLPDSRLVDRVAAPLDVLKNRNMNLDAQYYISRVLIPPLDRIFSLVGCNVRQWYVEMPKTNYLDIKPASPTKYEEEEDEEDGYNIDGHFSSFQCLTCGASSNEDICDDCYSNPSTTISALASKIQAGEKRLVDIHRICVSCSQSSPAEAVKCESLDCSWLYARAKAEGKLDFLAALNTLFGQTTRSE